MRPAVTVVEVLMVDTAATAMLNELLAEVLTVVLLPKE
jgi:hypothetical protein